MSSLQMGLAWSGAVLLLAMLGYYLWLARSARPRRTETAKSPPEAPDLREPTLHPDAAPPDFADTFAIAPPEKKAGLDALLDALAPISLDAPVSGDAVLAALPPTRRLGSKPFALEGFNAATQTWELPQAGQRYSQLQAGVQLANRSGPLNEIEFSEFVMKTQAFCDAVGGAPDFPEMRQEMARARELDQFAGDHDAQIAIVLRARRTAWSRGYVQQMAARAGFVPGPMAGRMVLPASAPGLPAVLSMVFEASESLVEEASQSALRELSFTLDVPQVEPGENGFARLCEVSLSLARDMDAVLTDDKGVALPPGSLEVIASELEQLHATLERREFAAGSALARRLFS